MNVSLTPELEKFVVGKVESGRYQTASEVVRAGLRLLEQRDELFKRVALRDRDDLEAKLETGFAELDAGKGIRGDVAVKRLRKRAASRRKADG